MNAKWATTASGGRCPLIRRRVLSSRFAVHRFAVGDGLGIVEDVQMPAAIRLGRERPSEELTVNREQGLLYQHHNRSRTDYILGPEHLLLQARFKNIFWRLLACIDHAVPRFI